MALFDRVVKFAEGLLEVSLSEQQKSDVAAFIEENEKYVSAETTTELIATLATEYVNDLQKQTGDMNISKFLGMGSLEELKVSITPKANKKLAYVCLDSRYARFSPDCKHLQWDVYNAISEYGNSTNVIHNLRNITRVRCASIVTRKFASPMARASVLIEELSAQSFVFPNGKRFHFLALLNDLQLPMDLGSRNEQNGPMFSIADFTIYDKYELLMGYRFNEGIYNFNIPVNILNTITVAIGDPVDLLVIPKYEYFNATITLTSPFYQDFTVTLNEPHNLNGNSLIGLPGTPYSIFLDGLVSDFPNSALDTFFVNNVNGKEWAAVLVTGPNTLLVNMVEYPPGFYVGVPNNFMGFSPQQTVFENVRVRINSFRVIINLEIEYEE